MFRRDTSHRLGRSPVVWVVLLALIIFTSTVWMRQATEAATERAVTPIQDFYTTKLAENGVAVVPSVTRPMSGYLRGILDDVGSTLTRNSMVQTGLIVRKDLENYRGMEKNYFNAGFCGKVAAKDLEPGSWQIYLLYQCNGDDYLIKTDRTLEV